jgi:hypothetical protein
VAGGAAAGVDDAAPGVAALEAERELAVGVEIEDDAARAQLPNGGRGLVDQDLDRARPAQTAAGSDGVGGVLRGRVARLERRCQAPLGPVAGALRERRARDEADAPPLLGGLQGGPEASRAAADDGDVELRIRCYRCPASRRIAST